MVIGAGGAEPAVSDVMYLLLAALLFAAAFASIGFFVFLGHAGEKSLQDEGGDEATEGHQQS